MPLTGASESDGPSLKKAPTMFTDPRNNLLPNDNTDSLPEPGSVLMLLSGIAGLQMMRRRRAARMTDGRGRFDI
jgi:hypothetical protein